MKKILLADASPHLIREWLHAPEAASYHIETALSGSECLQKVHTFQPDLILLDLLLPEMHGIEILKKIQEIGVILTSDYPLLQHYKVALKFGALYFLAKPFPASTAYTLIERFFQGTLKPDPFQARALEEGEYCYLPKTHLPDHYIRFWGTRGSNPVSGPEYLRYGGCTSCLEICYGEDRVIIDAGTGIRPLGQQLSKEKTIHLLFSHTHWDHLTGFPFFQPLYDPDQKIVIWTPVGFEKSTRELFTEILASSFFPVRLDDIQAQLTFQELHADTPLKIGNIEITPHYAFHPGSTLCFKVRVGAKTFGYVTDNEFLMGYHGHPDTLPAARLRPHLSLIEAFKGCDFLIHEAQYLPTEYQKKVGWGHSSVSNATVLIKHAQIKEWIVTHHDPAHTDSDLQKKFQLHEEILRDCGLSCTLHFAYDGLVYPL